MFAKANIAQLPIMRMCAATSDKAASLRPTPDALATSGAIAASWTNGMSRPHSRANRNDVAATTASHNYSIVVRAV
jgi:hypothetical protein